jgi:hypothetical protein
MDGHDIPAMSQTQHHARSERPARPRSIAKRLISASARKPALPQVIHGAASASI